MKVKDIVSRVREYLDEVDALNDVVVLNGSAPVDERIMSLIPECAVTLMDGREVSDEVLNTFVVDASGMATMDVPQDWGRLYELRLSCWKRSVYHTIGHESAQYQRQQSVVTRGGTVRPVVAIVPYGGGRRLEMYSAPAWDSRVTVERASYVPIPIITDGDSELSVNEERMAMLCYMVAVRVSRTYGQASAVELLSASLQEELIKNNINI